MKKLLSEVVTITTETKFARNDFQEHVFQAFGGYEKFWRKIGIYLKAVTGGSCQFTLERFGYEFITLRIRKPCSYYRGIKLEELADFFNVSLYERSDERSEERREYGGGFRPPAPVSHGGVAIVENTVERSETYRRQRGVVV